MYVACHSFLSHPRDFLVGISPNESSMSTLLLNMYMICGLLPCMYGGTIMNVQNGGIE